MNPPLPVTNTRLTVEHPNPIRIPAADDGRVDDAIYLCSRVSRYWQPTEPGHRIVALAVIRIVRAADRMREAYVLRDGFSRSAFSKGAAGPVASDR